MPYLPQYSASRPAKAQGSRTRDILICLTLLLGLSWSAYIVLNRSANISGGSLIGKTDLYSSNAQSRFKDMIQLLDLPSDLVPETGKHRRSSRLVIVGDVHGQKSALVALLAKLDFNEKHDHLILAGDMISKGPDSPGVVDLAMKLGATGVRGNHEDRVILAHRDINLEHAVTDAPNGSESAKQDAIKEQSASHGDSEERALVKALGEKRIKWLETCPVILRVGKLGSMAEVVVVHAGLMPDVELKKQDPLMVMNMRTIGDDGLPSDARDGIPWIKTWNKYQKSLRKAERTTVIYGHDSKRGLQTEKYSIGIDTGCLKGGKLTAVVIESSRSNYRRRIIQVDCVDGRAD